MRVAAIEGHRIWAPTYDSGQNPLIALERRAMQDLLKPLRPSRVVDVACGTGQWLLYFQSTGSNVFGCDACKEMLSRAAESPSLRGRIALAYADCIPFHDGVADLVLCSISLGYFQNLDRVFGEFARAARPGGLVAVSDVHPKALASGWTRSFKANGLSYEMEHECRALRAVNRAASRAGLMAKSCRAIYFGPPEAYIFQRAEKAELLESFKSLPALFIGLWEKPC